MIGSKLLKRFKAAATCAAVAVTALAAPMSAENDHADAAYNVNYAKALQYSLSVSYTHLDVYKRQPLIITSLCDSPLAI